MLTLTTADGTPVDVIPVDPDDVARQMQAALNDDGPDGQEPPRRTPAPDGAEKPKARRGRPPKEDKSRTVGPETAPVPPSPAETAPVPPSPAVTAKRAASAEEAFKLAGTCLLLVGKVAHMPSFLADGYVVNANAAPLAEKLALVAAVEPQIAKWLDKAPSEKVTAWMGLASVTAGLGLQAAANHKIIKPGAMGTTDPAEVIRANEEAIAAAQKAAEEEAAEMARLAEEDAKADADDGPPAA